MPNQPSHLKIAIALAAWGVLLLGAWIIEHTWTEQCLATSAVETRAVVTDRPYTSGKGGPRYYLTFEFGDASGRAFAGRQSVTRERFDAVAVGTRIPVLYCPANPARHAFDLATLRRETAGFTRAAAVLTLLLGGSIAYLFAQAMVARRNAPLPPPQPEREWLTSTSNRHPRRVTR